MRLPEGDAWAAGPKKAVRVTPVSSSVLLQVAHLRTLGPFIRLSFSQRKGTNTNKGDLKRNQTQYVLKAYR